TGNDPGRGTWLPDANSRDGRHQRAGRGRGMTELQSVDHLDVLVIVDNVTDNLSSTPANVISEWSGLLSAGRLPTLAGRNICCAHHGLSLLIAIESGGRRSTMLFDTGPDGASFLRNAKILGIDFGAIDAVVLSHGHWDHGGGLIEAIEAI